MLTRLRERYARRATVLVACAMPAGCLTTSPPALSTPTPPPPTILHDSVAPPADELLAALPSDGEFSVFVQLQDPSETFQFDVFVDYSSQNPLPVIFPVTVTPSGVEPNGIVMVSFTLDAGMVVPMNTCHVIEFLAAHQFATLEGSNEPLYHVPNGGGDSVTWIYAPGGGIDGCAVYDAGVFQDGATPPDSGATLVVPAGDAGPP